MTFASEQMPLKLVRNTKGYAVGANLLPSKTFSFEAPRHFWGHVLVVEAGASPNASTTGWLLLFSPIHPTYRGKQTAERRRLARKTRLFGSRLMKNPIWPIDLVAAGQA